MLSLVKLNKTDGAESSIDITTDRINHTMLREVMKRKCLVCIATVLTKGALKGEVQTRNFSLIFLHRLVGPGGHAKTLHRVGAPSRVSAKTGLK